VKTAQLEPPNTLGVTEVPVAFLAGLNLYIAALYLNVAVTAAGFVIPGALGLFGALLLVRHVRNLLPAVWLVAFLTLSLAAGGSGADMFATRLPSYVQIVAAIGCAHILMCAMTDYAVAVRKTLLAWMLFVTVGVILETLLPPFRDMSDAFRGWAFDGRFVYSSEKRDLAQYGIIRPTLFSQEPSHVSKAFVVFAAGWYVLATPGRRFAVLLVCTVLVTLFLRSPFTLLAVPLALFLAWMASGRATVGLFAAGVPILVASVSAFPYVFPARWQHMMSGGDFSFYSRFQAPYEVAAAAIERHPVFGVGIGAKEALRDEMYWALSRFMDVGRMRGTYLDYFNNAFANSFMFFGLVGGLVFLALIAYWAWSFWVTPLVSLPVVVLFFQLDGALEGIRMWSSIAVVLGCYLAARSRASARRLSESQPTP